MATNKAQEPGGKGLFTKANLKAFLLVNLGVLLLTVGVYFFKLPNNFTTGGVSGLARKVGLPVKEKSKRFM